MSANTTISLSSFGGADYPPPFVCCAAVSPHLLFSSDSNAFSDGVLCVFMRLFGVLRKLFYSIPLF